MIKAGTPITVSVSGSAAGLTSGQVWAATDVDSMRHNVGAELLTRMQVIQFNVQDRGVFDLGIWQYTATLVVAPYSDYGDAKDVASFIRTAFTNATGYLPTMSIPTIGQPAQPGQTPAGPGLPDVPDVLKPVKDLLSGLDDTLKFVIVAGVLLVAVVAFSPAAKGLGQINVGR